MFSFFSSRQRQHERIMTTLNKITTDAAERSLQEAERSNRRAARAREELAEEQHSNYMKKIGEVQFLQGKCYHLSDELADYKDLAAYWSNSYELALRTLNHMVEHWKAIDAPDEDLEARRARKDALWEQMLEAVLADETWPARREERHQARINSRRR